MRTERHASARPAHAEWPSFELAAGIPYGMEQIKETHDRMRVNADAVMEAFQKTCATAANLGAEWNAKVAEATHQNLTAGMEFAGALAAAKSLPQAIEVATAHWRKQVDATLAQNREFLSLGQKLISEAAKPMAAAWVKPLGPDVSS
jgi:phasin